METINIEIGPIGRVVSKIPTGDFEWVEATCDDCGDDADYEAFVETGENGSRTRILYLCRECLQKRK